MAFFQGSVGWVASIMLRACWSCPCSARDMILLWRPSRSRVGTLFAAVIPITLIKSSIRKSHRVDRHVGESRHGCLS